jgi:hypothetical protein
MENIRSRKSYIKEKDKFVEQRKKEERSSNEIYSLVDKAYYIDELLYKIGT